MSGSPQTGDSIVLGGTQGADRKTIQRQRRQQHRRSGRRWPKRLLVALVVLAVLAGGSVAAVVVYANHLYDKIAKVKISHTLVHQAAPGQPFNILMVGSDTRSFVGTTPVAKNAFEGTGGTTVGGQRSDVTMVARFIPATKQVTVLSIPRDLWVTIPGTVAGVSGMNRINAAFNNGPALLIQTIETDLDIPINYYMSVNFQGFQSMVTSIGGVTMDFPTELKDSYSGLDITKTGCQVVDGATALELVRARHVYYMTNGTWAYDGLSDFSRIQRQDAFFRALLQKVDAEKLTPFAMNDFLEAAVHNITIATTLSESDLISIAQTFHGIPNANLRTETLPTTSMTTTAGADVLNPAQPWAQAMITSFNQLGLTSSSTTTTSQAAGGSKQHHEATTSTTAVPPSAVDVEVLNGVDFTEPVATDTANELREAGFSISGIANATTPVELTEIKYAPGHEGAAETLAGHISGKVNLLADTRLTGDDVVLTVGSTFSAVTGLPAGATSASGTGLAGTAPTTTTSTTLPQPPGNVYTNTQAEPWNPTPCTL